MVRTRLLGAAISLLVLGGQALTGIPAAAATASGSPSVVQELKHDRSASLRSEQQGQNGPNDLGGHNYRPIRPSHSAGKAPAPGGPAQTAPGAAAMPSTGANFEGIANVVNGPLPPDTNGDIGPNHYVQWVNLRYQIFNRSGVSLLGPRDGNTLWSGFGGVCETTNQGDPIVRYDRMADRWVFTQFAFNTDALGNLVPPYIECLAVSTTGDPTGSYYRYAFQISNVNFNDYPKLSVWPDGYYMTFNYFDSSNVFVGAGAWAFDRSKMLTGAAATAINFSTSVNYGGLLSSDLDGSIRPPAGSPNYVAAIDNPVSGTVALAGSTLFIWKFHVDWTTPANSTFGTATHLPDYNLAVASYKWDPCNSSQNCVTQPGTSVGLDSLADRLMNRLQYRRFADGHESLVANHSVGVGTSGNQVAIRWYEIRNLSTTPTVYQQGTYQPDSNNRWMGSIAMDQAGDIGLGYSVSSSTVSPSIRYTGRLASDPLGTLPQGEATIVAGSGSQTSTYYRWGDYSMMAVDPTDDCTFWYTQEYYTATSDRGWRTRVGSFKFSNCGTPAAPTGVSAVAGDASATVSWTAPASNGGSAITGYRVTPYVGTTAQPASTFTSTATSQVINGLSNGTTYSFKVAATNASGTGPDSLASNAVTPAPPATAPGAPTGVSATSGDGSATATWTAPASNGGSPITGYRVTPYIGTAAQSARTFSSTATSQTVSGLINGTTYTFAVAAINSVGPGPDSAASNAVTPVAGITVSQAPHGNWAGTYGTDGYALLGWNGSSDLTSLPAGATLVLDQGNRYAWNTGTGDVRALQSPDATSRRATTTYASSQLKLHLSFTGAYSGALHLYAIDWDSTVRRQAITVDDGLGARTATLSSDFSQGAWIQTAINMGTGGGTVTITINQSAGANAVLSGLFLGAPSAAPPAPTGLAATAASGSQINLAWTGSTGVSGYRVERSPDGTTGWAQIATPSTTTYSDIGLTPSTTYFYRVAATNSVGTSPPSAVASATTNLNVSQAPQGNWVGTYGTDGYALLGWTGSSDLTSLPAGATLVLDQGNRYAWNTDSTDVRALQSSDASSRRAASVYANPQLKLHITFTGAYIGTLHLYAVDWDSTSRRGLVTVNDGSGPRTASLTTPFNQGIWIHAPINIGTGGGTVTITVDRSAGANAVLSGLFLGAPTAAPPAPTGLTATAASGSQINLAWTGSSGVSSYQVQRSPDGSTGWALLGTPATTTYQDTGLTASTTYFYRVAATNAAGTSPPSAVASATIGLAVAQAPQGTWVGSYGADGYALLGWTGSSDLASLPAGVTLLLDQGNRYAWNTGTSDVRGLQSPDASSRGATSMYASPQLKLHLSFTNAYSGTLHLYAVDWDSTTRRQVVTIDDGSGPRTANLNTDFSQGAWITAPITVPAGGTLTLTADRNAGANAVLSGLFLR